MTEEEKKLFEQAVEFFNKKDYDKWIQTLKKF